MQPEEGIYGKVLYHEIDERVDLLFVNAEENPTFGLLVAFEPGHPEHCHRDDAWGVFGQKEDIQLRLASLRVTVPSGYTMGIRELCAEAFLVELNNEGTLICIDQRAFSYEPVLVLLVSGLWRKPQLLRRDSRAPRL